MRFANYYLQLQLVRPSLCLFFTALPSNPTTFDTNALFKKVAFRFQHIIYSLLTVQYQCEIQTAYRREDVLSRVPTGLHLATANSALLFNDRIIFPFLAPSYLSKHIAWTGGNFFVGSFQSLAGKGQHCF